MKDMKVPKIDLNATKTQPEPVEVDTYDCRFTGHKYNATSKASGKPYVNFEFTGDEGVSKGRKFFGMGSLSNEGLWKFKSICVALGVDDFPTDFDTDKAEDVDALLKPYYGGHITLAIGQEEAKDKDGKPQGYNRNTILKYGVEELAAASKQPF